MRKNKYGVAKKEDRTLDGVVYDSKLEMNYLKHLELLKHAEKDSERIVFIQEQVKYEIKVNNIKICTYLLDFKIIYASGRIEYVDCKGVRTAVYSLKAKLMLAVHGIKIKEVKKGDF